MLDLRVVAVRGSFRLEVAFGASRELVALLGESGSGKSTLLQTVAGVLTPQDGVIQVDTVAWFDRAARIDLAPQQRRAGYVPQNFGLFPHLTVAQNITFARDYGGLRDTEPLDGLLRTMRLRGLERRYPQQLSGGQQQRVALARALYTRPRLLLLDEPFSSLDRVIRDRLLEDLRALHETFRLTTLLVTHDLEDAFTVADRIGVLHRGHLIQFGPRREVFDHPANEDVARLTGIRNLFDATVVGVSEQASELATPRFRCPGPPGLVPGQRVRIAIRPDLITLVRPERAHRRPEPQTTVEGRIVREMDHGAFVTLFFVLGERQPAGYRDHDLEVRVASHAYEVLRVPDQRRWRLAVRQSAVHVFGAPV